MKNHVNKWVALKCWKWMLCDGLRGWGKNVPPPCPASSYPPSFHYAHQGEWRGSLEGGVTKLLSRSQGLKSVDKMCTEQPESLCSQAGRSEHCQKLLAPSPSLMLWKNIVGSMTLRVCWLVFVCLCLDVCNSKAGLRLSKAPCLVGNVDQHVTERDNFHNGF